MEQKQAPRNQSPKQQFHDAVYNTLDGIEREGGQGYKTGLITMGVMLATVFASPAPETILAAPVILSVGAHFNRVRYFGLKEKFNMATEDLSAVEKAPLKELERVIKNKDLDLTLDELNPSKHGFRVWGGLAVSVLINPVFGLFWVTNDYLAKQMKEFKDLKGMAIEKREQLPPRPQQPAPPQA